MATKPKSYKFNGFRFVSLVLLGRMLVALVFAIGGMGGIVAFMMRLIGGAAFAAVFEGERKGTTDKMIPVSQEWSRIKRGMLTSTATLDLVIVGLFSALLIATGDVQTLTGMLSAPLFVGSVIICYAAIIVIMPLIYFSRVKMASTPVGLK